MLFSLNIIKFTYSDTFFASFDIDFRSLIVLFCIIRDYTFSENLSVAFRQDNFY